MKTNIRDWVIAFAVTSPLAALIYVGTGVLVSWGLGYLDRYGSLT